MKLIDKGHDAIHTRELPNKNSTDDQEIIRISIEEKRIVITKDKDFLDLFLLRHEPYKMVLVKTGNLLLMEMNLLIDQQIDSLLKELEDSFLIELYRYEFLVIT